MLRHENAAAMSQQVAADFGGKNQKPATTVKNAEFGSSPIKQTITQEEQRKINKGYCDFIPSCAYAPISSDKYCGNLHDYRMCRLVCRWTHTDHLYRNATDAKCQKGRSLS